MTKPRKAKDCVSHNRLCEILKYNKKTGAFTWLISPTGSVVVGSVAGNLSKRGYIEIRIDKKAYKAHRLAWFYVYGVWPNQVDHDDHDRSNNKWLNLNEATAETNAKNRTNPKKNGILGVKWSKRDKNWRATISVDGKRVCLGSFVDKFEAICAKLSANNKHGYHINHGR